MATNWTEIYERLDYFLNDTGEAGGQPVDRQHSDQMRIFSWNWAQDVFAEHTARERESTLVIDKDSRSAILSEDCFEVAMIYDAAESLIYTPAKFQFGGTRYDDSDDYNFWVWGNTLYLGRSVSHTEKLTLNYYAYWPDVEFEEVDDVVKVTQA